MTKQNGDGIDLLHFLCSIFIFKILIFITRSVTVLLLRFSKSYLGIPQKVIYIELISAERNIGDLKNYIALKKKKKTLFSKETRGSRKWEKLS